MANSNSPLRYPGGKAVLSDFLASTIEANQLKDCTYVEPYAGGAGAAVNLLLEGKVEQIILNDYDRSVWSFWYAILNHTDAFVERIKSTRVTVAEWKRQREIYRAQPRSEIELGFAAFFLNRCNRSGIMTNGGVIGGLDQSGKWKIDARYNKDELIRRIEAIASLRDKIKVCNLDAIEFLQLEILKKSNRSKFFVYLDPPYFEKGSRLYLNFYDRKNHAKLAGFLHRIRRVHWLVTYDNTPTIRDLYAWRPITDFGLHYSAAESKNGREILITSPGLRVPVEELARSA